MAKPKIEADEIAEPESLDEEGLEDEEDSPEE